MLPQQPTDKLMFYYAHSMIAVTRIMLNLNNNKVIENIAIENLRYLSKGVISMKETGLFGQKQGMNWLDGGAPFYQLYQSKDKIFHTVAPMEPKFYTNFIAVIRQMGGLSIEEFQYLEENQLNVDEWEKMKTILQKLFSQHKSRDIDAAFEGKDCCVERVLTT